MPRERKTLERELGQLEADERYARREYLVGPNGSVTRQIAETADLLAPWELECQRFEVRGRRQLLELLDAPQQLLRVLRRAGHVELHARPVGVHLADAEHRLIVDERTAREHAAAIDDALSRHLRHEPISGLDGGDPFPVQVGDPDQPVFAHLLVRLGAEHQDPVPHRTSVGAHPTALPAGRTSPRSDRPTSW